MPGALHIEMVGVGHGDCFILQWVPATGLPSTTVIDGGPSGGGMKLDCESAPNWNPLECPVTL